MEESKSAFKLELSSCMKIYPIFHVLLFTLYHINILSERVQSPSSSIIIEEFEEFEVEEILDSWIYYNKLQYFVDWKDYKSDEWIWESIEFLKNAKDVIARFIFVILIDLLSKIYHHDDALLYHSSLCYLSHC